MMATWRKPPGPAVPAWVLADIESPLVDEWLDALHDEDPQRWYEAFVLVISTPTPGRPG
jgi:hypothetical protein